MGVGMDMDVDVDVGVDVVGVGMGMVGMVVDMCIVMVAVMVVGMGVGVWGKGNRGRKLGGGGERRSEEGFNVQRSKFNKVELWHVTLKPVMLRERVAREGGDTRERGHERADDVAVSRLRRKNENGYDLSILLISYLVLYVYKLTWLSGSVHVA